MKPFVVARALLGAIVLAALGAAPVVAADLPVRTFVKGQPLEDRVYDWTGVYAGVYAGYGWGTANATTAASCPANSPPGWFCAATAPGSQANVTAVNTAGTGNLNSAGFTGGAQVGYNWQTGRTVLGAEADFGALNLKSNRTSGFVMPFAGFGATSVGTSVEAHWLMTARGRLGWAASNAVLIYATGGLALTSLKVANSYRDQLLGAEAANNTALKAGWTAGAGAEWAINRDWSVKGEYLYVRFTANSVTGNASSVLNPGSAQPITVSSDLSAHLVRLGLNYRFDTPVLARF